MGDSSQPVPVASGNASSALSSAAQTVPAPAVPTTLVPVYDSTGKQITVTVNGVKAVIQGYDKATGKLHLTCADTPENQAKFRRSTQPKTDRTNEPSTDSTVRFFRDSQGNPLTITVKNPALAAKINGSQMVLSQQDAEKAIRNSKRTLMHIVDKTAQAEAVHNNQPVKTEKEGWWSKHWWKVLLGVLIAATIGILGFRKGGWWNKRPKTPPTPSTAPTTPGFTLDPGHSSEYTGGTDTPPNTTAISTQPVQPTQPTQPTHPVQPSPLGPTVNVETTVNPGGITFGNSGR